MRFLTPQQSRTMRWRARLLCAVLAGVCFGGLLLRLAVLMLRDPDGYARRAGRDIFCRRHAFGCQRNLLDHPRRPA